MPTLPDYAYLSVYGVADWKEIPGKGFADAEGLIPEVDGPFGGGSVRGGDNLIQGVWTIFGGSSFPFIGQPHGAQLRPTGSQTGSSVIPFIDQVLRGFQQVANSRTSAKFGVTYPDDKNGQDFLELLAVINPPSDLKQKFIATALKTLTVGPTPPFINFDGEVFKSLLTPLMWSFRGQLAEAFAGLGFMETPAETFAIFGGQAFPLSALPILITDGSDGEYPQFFPLTSFQDFIKVQERILTGDFWIPMIFVVDTDGDPDTLGLMEVAWPHSSAQGGA